MTPHPPQAVPLPPLGKANDTSSVSLRLPPCLAAARSPLGSNSPPDCYSIPRGRFATHWGRQKNCGSDAVKAGAHAGNLLKVVSAITGGKGGGRPDSAMSGGKEISKVDEALAEAEAVLKGQLK